ncbi:MAG: HAD-IB family phosphatase [Gammaproteobacteria bacterium]
MTTFNWQLSTPLDAIIFDCDGTLSSIEGVDELAKQNGAGEAVTALTAEAMGKTGINLAIYQERLNLVRPTQKQVLKLGQLYFDHQTSDAANVIQILKRLNKTIYVVSAGLYPAVALFGDHLGIDRKHIFAVDIQFDAQDQYLDFDHQSPMTHRDGKKEVVRQIKLLHKEIGYTGDGLNDLATKNSVTRFVGYGGAYYRQNIADLCEFYLCTPSMAALLPLFLTSEESQNLLATEKNLYKKGIDAITENKVIIK